MAVRVRQWEGDPSKWNEVMELLDYNKLACESCRSTKLKQAMYFGDPDFESVECIDCGSVTDYWDAMKAHAIKLWEEL